MIAAEDSVRPGHLAALISCPDVTPGTPTHDARCEFAGIRPRPQRRRNSRRGKLNWDNQISSQTEHHGSPRIPSAPVVRPGPAFRLTGPGQNLELSNSLPRRLFRGMGLGRYPKQIARHRDGARPGIKLLEPGRNAIQRDQLVGFKARPDQSPFCIPDKDFRDQRAGCCRCPTGPPHRRRPS